MNKGNILIVDDEAEIRNLLSKLFQLEGYLTYTAENINSGLKILSEEEIQVLILDVRLKEVNSIDYLPEIKNISPLTEIIMLTAYGKISDGVNSIKLGAFDYITKGDDDDKVIPTVKKALEKNRLSTQLSRLQKKISTLYSFDNIIGDSPIIKKAISLAEKLTTSDTTVLLKGETGTGKEIFAQSIHYNSDRANHQFVAINCSAIPSEILESELFGYKKGAFTGADTNKKGIFEEAHGGTLFLDEISEMAFNLQAKLLRVLETKTFIKPGDSKETQIDIRIIAASNVDMDKAIEEGAFRKDLFYRISTFIIELPSLRERKEDIPILADYFIKYFSTKLNKPIVSIEHDFYSKLRQYSFPGNIRELRNICERVVILSEKGAVVSDYLPQEFFNQSYSILSNSNDLSISFVEKQQIQKVLSLTDNNKNKTAELLGIGLTTLYRKIEQYNIGE
ncbi:MAG: sigma-54 dependent transcriptional regulator [Melioribacteraceae bacterium]|nr:sigma-54 dependent transcriptional regulator [Melioribacteraceae bacterium]MCF8396267.1 sigma-54 dependent transcriptional regulator [Melioribacteraceae bacterium]MCF8421176.1 sigma-54 dependent transcriptional regulator [Melioribacteraceae bacterium]